MKNLKRSAFALSILIALLCVTGCKEPEPKIHYKYTIWVGSAVVAVGYDTNHYEATDSDIKFKTRNGKTKVVPRSNLYAIDEN